MKNSSSSMFLDPDEKLICFIGGGGKSTLIHHLSKDCISIGQTAAIFSMFNSIIPLEAHTLITDDKKNFIAQLKLELKSSPVVYVGKKLQNDKLEAFSNNEIQRLLKLELPADRIFIEADTTNGRSVSGYVKNAVLNNADRWINIMGADAFNKQKSDTWIKSRDTFWLNKDMLTPINLAEWIDSRDIFKKIKNKNTPVTFFLNKVENIFTQNLAHSFGKKVKQSGFDRVIIGSVFNSQFQLIE